MQRILLGALGALMIATPALADWTLLGEESKIAFGSIKSDTIGESHHFTGLSGGVGADGTATVDIDVASVETWIDIRNERMRKIVFDSVKFPVAAVSTQIDIDKLSNLKPGESTVVSTTANVSLAGIDIPVEADLFVVAISDNKVLVTTDEMIMLETADLGIDSDVDELMELASLPSITRVSPVTLRLVFEKE
ncbi:MAG: YceI family protein [Pseudomonadota bacterium]